MADNKGKRGSPDNRRIDVHDSDEVRHWRQSFNCTTSELKVAVTAAGTSAAAVRAHLGKKKK